MRIAIVGTRGIPNRYGGFERFAEQISSRFADRGHRVTVYCRRAFTSSDDVYDRRVRRVIVPSLHQKHLDTWVSTFIAAMHVAFTDNATRRGPWAPAGFSCETAAPLTPTPGYGCPSFVRVRCTSRGSVRPVQLGR